MRKYEMITSYIDKNYEHNVEPSSVLDKKIFARKLRLCRMVHLA